MKILIIAGLLWVTFLIFFHAIKESGTGQVVKATETLRQKKNYGE